MSQSKFVHAEKYVRLYVTSQYWEAAGERSSGEDLSFYPNPNPGLHP